MCLKSKFKLKKKLKIVEEHESWLGATSQIRTQISMGNLEEFIIQVRTILMHHG